MNSVYQTFDFLIFPSESESLGLVGLEAMANGVPVIGSDISGILTYLRRNENGFIFIAKNQNDLFKKINESTRLSVEEYVTLSENAIKTAERFSKENTMIKMDEIFLEII